MTRFVMGLAPGARLGPYEIVAAIGAGGMGEVYKARDTRLDRTVAIKVLLPGAAADPERRRRFEQEARAASALNHPHICVVHDIGSHEGIDYLVMEHLTGETLAQRLAKGPLPLDQALTVAMELAEALAVAHKQGIIHRDLKPGNVMLTKTGAKLLDFGLAKLRAHGPSAALPETSSPTEAVPASGLSTVLGTLPYMAPEQLEGKEADQRSDLFSFGAVVYEILTGRRAFEGSTAPAVIAAVMSSDPPPVSSLRPTVPPLLDRLVKECLAKDPDDRWQNAHDVADELRWVSRPGGAAEVARRPWLAGRVRLWVVAAALALAALAIGVAAFWLSGAWTTAGPRAPSAINSVAVLPLESLSGDASQDYFAVGLTDSLINELAQIGALRVISRTSVMRYKGTRKPLQEIARELNNVGAIVEGTVMREAGRVAITVRLIDTASDAQLWSQSYDRDLTDILTLRREIARSVAQGIRAALKPEEERRLSRRETVNPEAFDAYLRTIELRSRGAIAANYQAALESARQAVRLDARFAEAYVELAFVNASLWWYYFDHVPERVSEARSAADKALEIDPLLADAHRAKGIVLYHLDLDYERALREFSIALDRNPSDSQSLAYVGYVTRRQGRMDEAVSHLEKALAVDPLDATLLLNLGQTYALLRRPDEAERRYDDALRQNPVFNRPLAYKIRSRLRLRGDVAGAREVERQAEAAGLGTDPFVLYHRILLQTYAGDDAGALELLSRSPVAVFDEQLWYVPRSLLEAQAYDRLGRREQARAGYGDARRAAEAGLRADPGDTRYHSALGLALAGLGQKAAAIREGRAAVDALPVSRDAYRGACRLEDLAKIYALVGDRDAAVDGLGRLLALPTDLTAAALALDPAWAPLRGHAAFERLVSSSKQP
jgi:TolB-like protein/Flp pilus assembly protein TadD